MDKYTFQQLLREQRTSIQQGFLNVLYAVIFGVGANIIYDWSISPDSVSPLWVKLTLGLWIVFLLFPLYRIYRTRKQEITVQEEEFEAVLLMDQKTEFHGPVQLGDYGFSISADNDWRNIFGSNEDIRKQYLDSEAHPLELFGDYTRDFYYRVLIEYIEYSLLRSFSMHGNSRTEKSERERLLTSSIVSRLNVLWTRIYRVFLHIPFLQKRYTKRRTAKRMKLYFGRYPITSFPSSLQNNIWLSTLHQQQIEYERMILDGGDLPNSFGYLPLELDFPFETTITHQILRSGRRIILTSQYGRMQIDVMESSWSKSGFVNKTFNYIPRLRRDSDHYREVVFDIRISFHINKFRALRPWNSDEFEDYFEWGQKVIRSMIERFSWEHYRQTESRDEIMRLRRQFAQFEAEARIEMLYNFPDSIEGKVAKCLRWTRSWVWENRRDGLTRLTEMADEVPNELVDDVIQRLIVMSKEKYGDSVTPWKVTEALGVYSARASGSLVPEIYSALVTKLDTYDQTQRRGVRWAALGKSLAQVQKRLDQDEQLQNLHRVVSGFLGKSILKDDEISSLLWDNSTPAVQKKLKSFILEHVHSPDEEKIYTGIQYCLALRRQLEPAFLIRQLSSLLNRKPQRQDVKERTMMLAWNITGNIPESDRNLLLQFLLREIKDNESEIRGVAARTLKERYDLFSDCDEAATTQIIEALLSLSNAENTDFEFAAVSSLASYTVDTPPHFQEYVAEALLAKIQKNSTDPMSSDISIAAGVALQALIGSLPDNDLKQRIKGKGYA